MNLMALRAAERQARAAAGEAMQEVAKVGMASQMKVAINNVGQAEVGWWHGRSGAASREELARQMRAEMEVVREGEVFWVRWETGQPLRGHNLSGHYIGNVELSGPEWDAVKAQIEQAVWEDYWVRPETQALRDEWWRAVAQHELLCNELEQRQQEGSMGARGIREKQAEHTDLKVKARSGSEATYETLKSVRDLLGQDLLAGAAKLHEVLVEGGPVAQVAMGEEYDMVVTLLETKAEFGKNERQRRAAAKMMEELKAATRTGPKEEAVEADSLGVA